MTRKSSMVEATRQAGFNMASERLKTRKRQRGKRDVSPTAQHDRVEGQHDKRKQHDKGEGQHDKQRCFASLNMTRESNMTKKKQNRYNNKALKPNLSKKGFTC